MDCSGHDSIARESGGFESSLERHVVRRSVHVEIRRRGTVTRGVRAVVEESGRYFNFDATEW